MKNPAKRKGKRKMWILLIIVGLIVAGLIGGIMADAPGRREINDLTFADINFKDLKNGSYIGEFKSTGAQFRNATVEATISEGKLSNVKILKGALDKEGKPQKLKDDRGIDDFFNDVISSQTLQVDVISGATITCKAHLKALEDALEKAR